MRRFVPIVLGSLVIAAVLAVSVLGQRAGSSTSDRYQIEPADTGVFIVDSVNGQVWFRDKGDNQWTDWGRPRP